MRSATGIQQYFGRIFACGSSELLVFVSWVSSCTSYIQSWIQKRVQKIARTFTILHTGLVLSCSRVPWCTDTHWFRVFYYRLPAFRIYHPRHKVPPQLRGRIEQGIRGIVVFSPSIQNQIICYGFVLQLQSQEGPLIGERVHLEERCGGKGDWILGHCIYHLEYGYAQGIWMG